MQDDVMSSLVREVLLVGCGNMGFALLKGWLTTNSNLKAIVVEPDEALRQRAQSEGAIAVSAAADLPEGAAPQVIVIAVKPQYVGELLKQYSALIENGAFVLSVAAGVTISTMEAAVGTNASIIRCMPNTPAAVGAGALVCCPNANSGEAEESIARQLLASSGEVHFVDDEALMDAVTAVSGSGPAYIFHFIERLAEAGVEAGLPAELSKALALQTAYGASVLAKFSDSEPGVLRQQVTSPNGTTAAALAVLMAPEGLGAVIGRAVAAAKARSIELGRQ